MEKETQVYQKRHNKENNGKRNTSVTFVKDLFLFIQTLVYHDLPTGRNHRMRMVMTGETVETRTTCRQGSRAPSGQTRTTFSNLSINTT